MDVFPALLENDVPFYSHEIDAYWNDIGNLEELRQGNLDALRGEVEIESDVPEIGDGIRSASPIEGVEVEGPALIGSGVQLGEGARIQGPAIVGDSCRIGAGAWVRDSILLDGAEVAPGAMLVGAIAGRVAKP
jgi:NDP-sugar pyrophosphorylase family protein